MASTVRNSFVTNTALTDRFKSATPAYTPSTAKIKSTIHQSPGERKLVDRGFDFGGTWGVRQNQIHDPPKSRRKEIAFVRSSRGKRIYGEKDPYMRLPRDDRTKAISFRRDFGGSWI